MEEYIILCMYIHIDTHIHMVVCIFAHVVKCQSPPNSKQDRGCKHQKLVCVKKYTPKSPWFIIMFTRRLAIKWGTHHVPYAYCGWLRNPAPVGRWFLHPMTKTQIIVPVFHHNHSYCRYDSYKTCFSLVT